MYGVLRAIAVTAWAGVVVVGVFAAGVLGGSQTGSASAGAAAREQLLVRQLEVPLPLAVRGERVEVGYDAQRGPNLVETPKATGTLFVRNDLQRDFTAVPLKIRRALQRNSNAGDRLLLRALVPDRLLGGHKLVYYALIRDRRTGRVVTVPARGARAPETTLIINNAYRVNLGTHVFGHPQTPEAVVARAGPTQVGFGRDGLVYGPSAFEIATDRSVWLYDRVNRRVLAWASGRPNVVARTVMLPLFGGGDFAVGPAGSIYLWRGGLPGSPFSRVTRVSVSGRVLWTSRIAGGLWLRTGPDGTLYSTGPGPEPSPRTWWGTYPWVPVATSGGRPLSLAAQQQRTLWAQPLSSGLQLVRVATGYDRQLAPHEARMALLNRAGRVVRAWRIRSRTAIGWSPDKTPPALVAGDPVIVLEAMGGSGNRTQEYLVLRLGPRGGVRTRFALPYNDPPRSAYGDSVTADIRVEPDGKLYQLGSSPDFGAAIYRFSLRRTR